MNKIYQYSSEIFFIKVFFISKRVEVTPTEWISSPFCMQRWNFILFADLIIDSGGSLELL